MTSIVTPAQNWPRVWNPHMPGSLRSGLVFAGLGEHPGTTWYEEMSGLGNHGALTNMDPATDWVWSPELGRWALDFDGSNDYVSGPAWGQQNTSLSMVAWVKPAVVAGGYLFGTANSGSFSSGAVAFHTSGLLQWRNAGSGTIVYSGTALAVGAWRHIAATRVGDAGTLTWYLDGAYSNAGTATEVTQSNAGQRFCIGRWGDYASAAYYSGLLADMLVFQRVLDPSEVSWLADPTNRLRVPWVRRSWLVGSSPPAPPPTGSGSATILLSAAAAGSRLSSGSGAASVTLSAAGVGSRSSEGYGSAALAIAASGVGSRESAGSGSAAVLLAATAAGQRDSAGAGSSAVVLAATATGERASQGAGQAAILVSADAAGSRASAGAGSATVLVGAAGVGARISAGAGTAAVLLAADAAGSRASQGAGSATLIVSATGDGETPAIPVPSGAGTVTIVLSAAAVGSRASAGAGLARIVIDAWGVGARDSAGAGSATVLVSASGVGESPFYFCRFRVAAGQTYAPRLAGNCFSAGPVAGQTFSRHLQEGQTLV